MFVGVMHHVLKDMVVNLPVGHLRCWWSCCWWSCCWWCGWSSHGGPARWRPTRLLGSRSRCRCDLALALALGVRFRRLTTSRPFRAAVIVVKTLVSELLQAWLLSRSRQAPLKLGFDERACSVCNDNAICMVNANGHAHVNFQEQSIRTISANFCDYISLGWGGRHLATFDSINVLSLVAI